MAVTSNPTDNLIAKRQHCSMMLSMQLRIYCDNCRSIFHHRLWRPSSHGADKTLLTGLHGLPQSCCDRGWKSTATWARSSWTSRLFPVWTATSFRLVATHTPLSGSSTSTVRPSRIKSDKPFTKRSLLCQGKPNRLRPHMIETTVWAI